VIEAGRLVKEKSRLLHRRVSINGYLDGPRCRRFAVADFGDTAQHRRVEIACPALLANADGDVFKDNKPALVLQRLAIDSPLADGAIAVFAGEVIHAGHLF
jgi:hypothetical protein